MLYVALAEAAAIAVIAITSAGILRSVLRQTARERDLILNQLLHATGYTWTPPPAEKEPVDEEPLRLLRNVDQWPPEERVL